VNTCDGTTAARRCGRQPAPSRHGLALDRPAESFSRCKGRFGSSLSGRSTPEEDQDGREPQHPGEDLNAEVPTSLPRQCRIWRRSKPPQVLPFWRVAPTPPADFEALTSSEGSDAHEERVGQHDPRRSTFHSPRLHHASSSERYWHSAAGARGSAATVAPVRLQCRGGPRPATCFHSILQTDSARQSRTGREGSSHRLLSRRVSERVRTPKSLFGIGLLSVLPFRKTAAVPRRIETPPA